MQAETVVQPFKWPHFRFAVGSCKARHAARLHGPLGAPLGVDAKTGEHAVPLSLLWQCLLMSISMKGPPEHPTIFLLVY